MENVSASNSTISTFGWFSMQIHKLITGILSKIFTSVVLADAVALNNRENVTFSMLVNF